ncbi:MAG TPA: MFS transporter [Acidimicrobiales bacterium]|nr:MFS transporter [Acidimicrobiales bacterium]
MSPNDGVDGDVSRAEAEDAEVSGDVAYRPGSARAALSHPAYRSVWFGSFASNIGTWMQNVALGAFAYELTQSPRYVAALSFAQLGPMLLLSIVSGFLADSVNRKVMLCIAQGQQLLMSLALAWAASRSEPSPRLIFVIVLIIGVGNAAAGPVFAAVMPSLVGKRDLPGAISLQSLQLNLSRVIGPAIGGVLLPAFGAPVLFVINAATYVFVIAAVVRVDLPRPYPDLGESGMRRLLGGIAVARREPVVRACLITIAVVSFFCLPFVGLLPVIAEERLGIDTQGPGYGVLYALFGLGAATGAISIGTVLYKAHKPTVMRVALLAFGGLLVPFGLLRVAAPAYPLIFAIGTAYFMGVTALSTVLNQHLNEQVRGRVMALWMMAFGGTVPLGTLAAGAVVQATSISVVVIAGGLCGLALASWHLARPAALGRRA